MKCGSSRRFGSSRLAVRWLRGYTAVAEIVLGIVAQPVTGALLAGGAEARRAHLICHDQPIFITIGGLPEKLDVLLPAGGGHADG